MIVIFNKSLIIVKIAGVLWENLNHQTYLLT